jgi:hypothetical protein
VQGYKAQFYDSLEKNLISLENKLDTKDGKLTQTVKNTCLFAKALHQTYGDVGNVIGLMAITAACDFSPIDKN